MATTIANIRNLQQIEVAVAGPEGANRLFTITGQFDPQFILRSPAGATVEQSQTFIAPIGPSLTRQQFIRAIATASLAKTNVNLRTAALVEQNFGFGIGDTDADWDDESTQVELRIEIFASVAGSDNIVVIGGVAFQVMILAA